MAEWKLCVENYGKIESAEIECSPLTLIVGDNNCGKSYLMSLLWGIRNYGVMRLLDGEQIWKSESGQRLIKWMMGIVDQTIENQSKEVLIEENIFEEFQNLINEGLNQKKDVLLSWIFNSNTVHADKIQITLCSESHINKYVYCEKKSNHITLEYRKAEYLVAGHIYGVEYNAEKCDNEQAIFFLKALSSDMLGCVLHTNLNHYTYLPAARTGFMLAKDVVNKVGREQTFNYSNEAINLVPFTRPINQFLDIINDLTVDLDGKTNYLDLAKEIETEILNGDVDISDSVNREVFYRPIDGDMDIPLRTVSAVVTELTPLVLLLKHSRYVTDLYYEEPEMCLHPQLQNMMGKILIKMVNSGINVVATTHSDILVQAINNRIKLYTHPQRDEICTEMNIDEKELIGAEKVHVYQFEKIGNKSRLVKLECGENGFAVPTFNNALDEIMEEAYKIQG